MSDIRCQCSCHCSVSNSQSDDLSDTLAKNLVNDNDNSAEIEEILNGMNLNPNVLEGIKRSGFGRTVASMDPSILQPGNGDHVFSIPTSTIPKFVDNSETFNSWIVRFVPVIPVLQQIDRSVQRCQVIIMSSSSIFLNRAHEAMSRISKSIPADGNPAIQYGFITQNTMKKYKYKCNINCRQIIIGTFYNILSLITTVDLDLKYIKSLVIIELDPSTERTSLDHEVWKYLPRNVKLFTSSDYLMRSIKEKFLTPAQEIKINPPLVPAIIPAPKIKKNKKKATKNEKKPYANFKRVEPYYDERNRKRKFFKMNKDCFAGTNSAQNVELQDCKKIKFGEDIINLSDTSDAQQLSVESRVSKEIKLEPEEEIMRIDTTSDDRSVESGHRMKIKEECIQID